MPTTITKTVKTSGGDYTSLAAFEAGEQADIVAADQIKQAECYSFADTTAFSIDGWTTDATRYVRIYTPANERHDGKYNTSKYRLEISNARMIDQLEDFVRFEGIQFQLTSNVGAQCIRVLPTSPTGETFVESCIFKGVITSTAEVDGISVNEGNLKCRNSVFYNFVNAANFMAGIYFQAGATGGYVYNNTLQNCRVGINTDVASTVLLKNNIFQDGNDGYGGTFHASSTNNCSDIASDAPGSNPQTGEVIFVDEANGDFHLDTSDTVAKDTGTDLSGDANYPFSDDIDGATRSGTWDIGADEITTTTRRFMLATH